MLSSELSTEHFCSFDNWLNLFFGVEHGVGRVVKWIIGMSYFCKTYFSISPEICNLYRTNYEFELVEWIIDFINYKLQVQLVIDLK